MILFETTLIAGVSAAILSASVGPWGVEWGTTTQLVAYTVAVGAGWAGLAAVFSHFSTVAYRDYAVSILVDTGLLYLALEHEPAEMLTSLKAAERIMRLSPAKSPSVLSFRHRMLALVRRFTACAAAIGFYPQPAMWRTARTVLFALTAGLLGIFAWLVWSAYLAARQELTFAELPLKICAVALVWTIMLFTVLAAAQRSAPVLALADVLLGEDHAGTAVRGGRNL